MPETKSSDIQLSAEQFDKLQKLNFVAIRIAQDAEVIVQEEKLKIAKSQKDIRDYIYMLSETLPINPSISYDLDVETKSLKKTKP